VKSDAAVNRSPRSRPATDVLMMLASDAQMLGSDAPS
jgi:hypothetical protein